MPIDFKYLGEKLTAAGLSEKAVDQYSKEEVEALCMACANALIPEKGAKFTPPSIKDGELVIPFDADPRFHWWRPCGQSVFETLRELKAPDDVWRKYIDAVNEPF